MIAPYADATLAALQTFDADLQALLSAPSRVSLGTAVAMLESATGTNIQELAIDQLTDVAMDLAGELSLEVLSSVPLLGQVVQVGAGIVGAAAALGSTSAEEAAANCRHRLEVYKLPPGSGSMLDGSTFLPADIFAKTVKAKHGAGFTAPQRPMLAQCLMLLTEGAWRDPDDDLGTLTKNGGDPYMQCSPKGSKGKRCPPGVDQVKAVCIGDGCDAVQQRSYERLNEAHAFLRVLNRQDAKPRKLGVPRARRAEFRVIRRGIEASHLSNLAPGRLTDGGRALWLAWLDLFLKEVDEGRILLDTEHAQFLLSHFVRRGQSQVESFDESWYYWGQGAAEQCSALVVNQIRGIVGTWRNTVRPYTIGGQAALAKLEAQAAAASRRALLGRRISVARPSPRRPLASMFKPRPRSMAMGPDDGTALAVFGVLAAGAAGFAVWRYWPQRRRKGGR